MPSTVHYTNLEEHSTSNGYMLLTLEPKFSDPQ
jgi:hypothetical protein